METINNVTSSVSKAIWGDGQNKEEPVSGAQGDTSKGEPYDAGNIEGKETSTNTTTTGSSSADPAKEKDSSALKGDSTKVQNDVRDPAEHEPEKEEAAKNVDDTGDGPNEVEPKGPGPKPIEEVAKEHGGDAGRSDENVDKTGDSSTGGDAKPAAAGGGAADEDDDGPQKVSHGEGTGEQYVKSTGLQADGGDFDATKPGAGREADRLLEEKGIVHEGNDVKAKDESSEDISTSKEKKSFGQKIKDKLHRN